MGRKERAPHEMSGISTVRVHHLPRKIVKENRERKRKREKEKGEKERERKMG